MADAERAALFMRRQLLLVAVAAGAAAAILTEVLLAASSVRGTPVHLAPVLRGGQLHVEPVVRSAHILEWSIVAALALTVLLMIVIARHALQVATFALRKEVR